jgi:aspartate 1-decarboxylase
MAKTLRQVLLAEIHRLVVTRADVDGANALSLDRTLCEAAGFANFEKLEVTNATNGARFSAMVTAAEANSGTLSVDGAGAHLVRPGDLVTLSAFAWLKEKDALTHQPRRVSVDSTNSLITVAEAAKPAKKPKKAD